MTDLWTAVDRLLDRMDADAARAHGVGALAAHRYRTLGKDVPDELLREERGATIANMLVPTILGRVRAACDGPLIVFKGPEIAMRYPSRARRFADIDLLVPSEEEAESLQRALLASGFRLAPRDDSAQSVAHHEDPVEWPGSGLPVEIHHAIKVPNGLPTPPVTEVFEAAEPSALGLEGVLAPGPAHHTLILTAHTWSETPLRQLHDVIDIESCADGLSEAELTSLAASWGMARIWRGTRARSVWILGQGPRPLSTRLWGAHLAELREPTVLDAHVAKWLAPFSMLPFGRATWRAATQFADDLRPQGAQAWARMPRTVFRAVRNAFVPLSHHNRHAKADRQRHSPGTRDYEA